MRRMLTKQITNRIVVTYEDDKGRKYSKTVSVRVEIPHAWKARKPRYVENLASSHR